MSYKFTIITTKESGGFAIRCAELGVVSQGKNIKEAQKNIKEAIELYLEDNPESKKYLAKTESLISTLELDYA